MTSWIYVLHFERPLSHAHHYVGCTAALRDRLTAHARGQGSRLMSVLRDLQIEWRLASLYQTSHAGMRRIERQIKSCGHGPRFCRICKPTTPKLPGCKAYDVELIQFATDSVSLRGLDKRKDFSVRFTSHPERLGFTDWIRDVQHKDKDALGFIPTGGDIDTGIDRLIGLGQVIVATEDETDAGFLCYTLNLSRTRVRIHQCVVMDKYRLQGHGRRMLDMLCMTYDDCDIDCHVRADLAANHFWEAMGFYCKEAKIHTTSGSIINHYERMPDAIAHDPKEELPL